LPRAGKKINEDDRMVKGLIWFRTDLRIDDNPALLEAANSCD